MERDLSSALFATPNQASSVFGLGGAHPIRQKSLFVMRFLRKVGEGGDEWKNGLSFFVKSIDRPTVQTVTEELNQYNKKRIIHTGVKYNPVTCILYDTADSMVMSMLVQYSQYYFGDFRQDASGYADDIISPKMFGTSGLSVSGFGYGINNSPTSIDGSNTQFFFDKIEVYQVWGGEYTCFQLINPKIASYDPDELDYENSGASTVTVSLQYETIYHENGGKPQKISSNAALSDIFSAEFNGQTPDPSPSARRTTNFTATSPLSDNSMSVAQFQQMLANGSVTVPADYQSNRSDSSLTTGGALSQYGTFDFGDYNTGVSSNLPSEFSVINGSNPSPDIGNLNDPFPSWVTTTKQANELELARVQATTRANQSAVSAALGSASIMGDLMDGVGAAAALTGTSPSEQVNYTYDPTKNAPSAFVGTGVTSSLPRTRTGLSLSSVVNAVVNSKSDGRAQIGNRVISGINNIPFVPEPPPIFGDDDIV